MKKVISIGYEDFREIIEKEAYYVDKTLMIKALVDRKAKVSLFTRPRRFGKTLNLSMIRRFFEDERDRNGEPVDNRQLFSSLAIAGEGEPYAGMQQRYPVINLSLKSAKQPEFDMAYAMIRNAVWAEFDRHRYILGGDFSDEERSTYNKILQKADDRNLYLDSIRFLSRCLAKYHGSKAVILIDEYDVPLENAYFEGFYDEMASFVRSLFESALKTNDSLEFAAVTGCLRISRESIFTGLNNLFAESLRGEGFGTAFGFTQPEVDRMLDYYSLSAKREEVKDWYDGYVIGGMEIYNPWSVLNYVKLADLNPDRLPEPYWVNTSSNGIIRELIETADEKTKREMESLINGAVIEKPVHEEITYGDIRKSQDNLWNFLFFTGYLKSLGEHRVGNQIYMRMAIPNREICSVYQEIILDWFGSIVKESQPETLLSAVISGDAEAAEQFLTGLLQKSISFFDYAENYYHGFLTGVLVDTAEFAVVSNRESGLGRPDILIKSRIIRHGTAVILELKTADRIQDMENLCSRALAQIEDRNYAEELRSEGYENILKYGICFCKKECMVKKGQ